MKLEDLSIVDDKGRYRTPNPVLVDLARQIYKHYSGRISELASRAGRVATKPSSRHALHFYRAAELCQELDLSAAEYTDIQIRHMASVGSYWPNAIASRVPFEDADNDRKSRDLVALRRYQAQLDLLSVRAKLYGPKLALKDPANDFTPLFRCAMSRRHGFEDVERRYLSQALIELEANPVAKELFPEEVAFLDGTKRAFTAGSIS